MTFEGTITQRGTIVKIEDVYVNQDTGFIKRRMHFKPDNGKVFFPEAHYKKINLLTGFVEGDRVELTFKIWGAGTHKINNIIIDDLRHERVSGHSFNALL